MSILHYDNKQEVLTARWVARILSLLLGGFFLTIFVLNEDVRSDPTLPAIMLGIISMSMLVAWRWEKIGGALTIFLSPIFLLTIFIQWYGATGLMNPTWMFILIGAGMMFSFLIVGWLFVSVSQYFEILQEVEAKSKEQQTRKRRWGIYLVIGLLGIIAIAFFVISINIPVQQEMEYPEDALVATDYENLINELRAEGSVVGIGSVPVEQPLFTVTGLEINVDGEIVHLFKYINVESASKDAAAIHNGTRPSENEIVWAGKPRLYQVNNVLVLYVGSDETTISRIESAFGPPFLDGG